MISGKDVSESECVREAEPRQAAGQIPRRGRVRGPHPREWRGRDDEHVTTRQRGDWSGQNQYVGDDGAAPGISWLPSCHDLPYTSYKLIPTAADGDTDEDQEGKGGGGCVKLIVKIVL